jgi:cystathionine beta-lyase/cystathionine gamma-synthase
VAKAFGSGMAAVSATIIGLLKAGDHIVFVNQTYGPTLQLAELLARFGVEHTVVASGVPEEVASALRPNTRMLWMESPGTMLFGTLDLRALVDLAQSRDLLTCLDNSWATPLFLKPIGLGVDLVVHAGSKYLSGHSDVLSGAVVGPQGLMEQIFYRGYMLLGASLSPFDAWLQIRGLRTLPLRLRQHHEGGLLVAEFLDQHPAVERVYHPGLAANPAAELRGYSGLFSFALRSDRREDVHTVVDALRSFRIGVSWGGPESLVYSPQTGDPERLRAQGLPSGLIRLSVGLESPPSLIEDLDRALAALR